MWYCGSGCKKSISGAKIMQPRIIYSRPPKITPQRVSIPNIGRFIEVTAQNYARTVAGDPTTGVDINISEYKEMKDPMLIGAETDRDWVLESETGELWIGASADALTNLTIEVTTTGKVVAQDVPFAVKTLPDQRSNLRRIKDIVEAL
jgi:hypothetical protein